MSTANKAFGSGEKSAFKKFSKGQNNNNVIRVFITPQKQMPLISRKFSFSNEKERDYISRTP